MSNFKEYVPAALCYIASVSAGTILTGAFRSEQLKAKIDGHFSVDAPLDLVEASLDYTVQIGLSHRFDDEFTDPYYLLNETEWLQYYNEQNDSFSPFTKARLLGGSWIAEALQRLADRQTSGDPPVDTRVPASDRVVSLDDNARVTLLTPLEQISKELTTSNSIREELGGDAERITAEISAGETLIRADKIRLSALVAVLLKPLRYLSEKFAGAAIGTLAAELIKALLKLL
jgi:hypothetical protein